MCQQVDFLEAYPYLLALECLPCTVPSYEQCCNTEYE